MKLSDLPRLKELGIIVDYRIDGDEVYISPYRSMNFIKLAVVSFDGDDQVSTGKDIRADNSIGD